MPAAPMRALSGFIAAAISVLIFHQGMWTAIARAGCARPDDAAAVSHGSNPATRTFPASSNLCFWGGLYGIVFGLLLPRFTAAAVVVRPRTLG